MKLHALFTIGQIVQHRLFKYRGVIIDVDPMYLGSKEWYEEVALSRPPKDQPWYHVLVDNETNTTYVAERNLKQTDDQDPINHPELNQYFETYNKGLYVSRLPSN